MGRGSREVQDVEWEKLSPKNFLRGKDVRDDVSVAVISSVLTGVERISRKKPGGTSGLCGKELNYIFKINRESNLQASLTQNFGMKGKMMFSRSCGGSE